jgi:hypothetical protein
MSLSAHLKASGDHAVLPFDPACPLCRHERLAGRLPAAPLVSPRLTALAVAGVTAGCALTPAPAALAQQAPPAAEEELPELPTDVEDEPVESDVPDPNVVDVITDDPADAIDPSDPLPPADPALLGGAPTAATPPPATPPPATPPPAAPVEPVDQPPPPPPVAEAPAPAKPRPMKAPPRRTRVAPPPKPPAPAPAPVSPQQAAPAATPTTPAPAAGASYLVQPGDTLWSIAHARLGRAATPAAVAALVEAIWRANSAAIGTGDPDLIRSGMRLVIPGQR